MALGAPLDLLDSRLGFLGIAAPDDDLSAATSEVYGGVLAYAGIATYKWMRENLLVSYRYSKDCIEIWR